MKPDANGMVDAKIPRAAAPLLQPAPFKVIYGGRGSGKTESFCRALLSLGCERKLFILCAREIQKSIKDSVYKTLHDAALEMGLDRFYEFQHNKIIGANGTEFVFYGIRNNIASIKSMAHIDICAVFEATFVSQHSWEVLLPTVRRDPPHGPFGQGSEIWIEFNPELATDYTYKFWVGKPPSGTVRVEMNWRDNPFFPEFLDKLRRDTLERDPDGYQNIWEGKTRRVLQGSIYAKELLAATSEGRINPHVEWDRAKPVDVSFDLGKSDMEAVWCWQQVGDQHKAINFYGNTGEPHTHYLGWLQTTGYLIRHIYLPHDGDHDVAAAPKSIAAQTRDLFPGDRRVIVVPRIPTIAMGIDIVRNVFPRLWFHEIRCSDGLTALQHYQYSTDPETLDPKGNPARSRTPLHNWASNPADGLRTYCEGISRPVSKPLTPQDNLGYGGRRGGQRGGAGWLGR